MKKIFTFLSLSTLLILLSSVTVFAQGQIPPPRGHVNDFANIIPDDVEQRLEQTLRDYNIKTTNEIAIVTVESLGGQTIEDYTMRLAEQWKVGKKGKDNGAILLVAPNERKVRIEVGYSLEGVLTDAKAKMIIERVIIPEFRNSNFTAGIEKGVAEIIKVITLPVASELAGEKEQKSSESSSGSGIIVAIVFGGIALIAGLTILFIWIARACRRWSVEKKRKELVRQETLQGISKLEDELKNWGGDAP